MKGGCKRFPPFKRGDAISFNCLDLRAGGEAQFWVSDFPIL